MGALHCSEGVKCITILLTVTKYEKKKVKKIIRRQLRIREFGKMQDAFALAISWLFMSKG